MVRISICKVFRLYQHHRVLAIVLILFVDIRCTPIYQTNTLKELIRSLSLYNDFVLYGRFKLQTKAFPYWIPNFLVEIHALL